MKKEHTAVTYQIPIDLEERFHKYYALLQQEERITKSKLIADMLEAFLVKQEKIEK